MKNMPLKHLLLFDFSASISRHVQYCSSHMAAEDASVQHSLNSWQWYGADNSCRQGVKCWRYFKEDKKSNCEVCDHIPSVQNRSTPLSWIHVSVHKHQKVVNGLCLLAVRGWLRPMTELYWSSINTSHDKSSSWHREWTLHRYLPVDCVW